jgi:hypothetical protein
MTAFEQLQTRLRELERELEHQRSITDAERRARVRAEDSAKRAWSLATWRSPRRRDGEQTHADD